MNKQASNSEITKFTWMIFDQSILKNIFNHLFSFILQADILSKYLLNLRIIYQDYCTIFFRVGLAKFFVIVDVALHL